jgi:type II secretory pathway pseudopilin PulG
MIQPKPHQRESGMTLVEVMVTAVMAAIFFSGIFEVSAVCLRYISSSKENINAIECVQDRIEQLRGTDFTSLLDQTYMSVAPAVPAASPSPSPQQRRNLTTPPNASVLAQQGTETVKISTYSGTSATTPSVTYTRAPGAIYNATTNFSDTNVAPSVSWSGGASFPSTTTTVQVDVTYTWNAVLGGRTRSETSSTILSAGTKK